MNARRVVSVALALAAPVVCEGCLPSNDPLALPLDVVSIAAVIVAGETEAHVLAGFPHRPLDDPPPSVTAHLSGSGWKASFAPTALADCEGGPIRWPIPLTCLHAVLPEAVRAGVAYRIEGRAPLGSFTGEAVVPAAPVVVEPADTLRLRPSGYQLRVPIRYRVSSEIGTLRPEVAEIRDSSDYRPSAFLWPDSLDVEADSATLTVDYDTALPTRITLQLLGIGWNYTRFVEASESNPFRSPLPEFGIRGEGVFGYFDGAAVSGPIHVAAAAAER